MIKATSRMIALACALSLGTTGCLKKIIFNGTVASTRKGAAGVDTLGDYEVANAIAFAGLGQFEGMHHLAPDNEDALFLLTKGWTGATFAFTEDQMEQAEDAEGTSSPLYEYHKQRALAGYDRAIHYGIELLEMRNAGFEQARKNDETMKAWLAGFDDDEADAPNLFWTGYAWIAKVNVGKDDPALVSDLYIGVAIMERAAALNPNYNFGSPLTVLGSYHARTALAELDESKKMLDQALAVTGGKSLLPKFQLATKYYCMKADKENYVKTLTEIVDAGDTMPEQRLTNTIAKRRAKRYLSAVRMKGCGF